MASIWKITECGTGLVTSLNTLQPERDKIALDQISETISRGCDRSEGRNFIDQETEDTDEQGHLAAALAASVVACFMAIPEPQFQYKLNAAREAANLPWRMVPIN
jgi:hypothetical protein